jgi:hypothetical protein
MLLQQVQITSLFRNFPKSWYYSKLQILLHNIESLIQSQGSNIFWTFKKAILDIHVMSHNAVLYPTGVSGECYHKLSVERVTNSDTTWGNKTITNPYNTP